MDIAGVGKAMTGMAIFDMWEASFAKMIKAEKPVGDPLVAAACQAMDSYLQTAQVMHSAMIAGLSTYVLNPNGKSVSPVTSQEIAPFLALNLVA